MSEVVPLRIWYPAMHDKWQQRLSDLHQAGYKTVYPLSERVGWVIHHTVGGTGQSSQSYARAVADMHWSKWLRPGGYNFLVGEDGQVREMCGYTGLGAHAGTNEWNRKSLGLSFQGDFRLRAPSAVMLDAGASFIADTPISNDQWTHRAVRPEPTSCPGEAFIRLLPLEADMPLDANDLAAIRSLLEAHDETFDYTNSAGHTRRMSRLAVNSTWHVDIAGRRAMDSLANLKDLPTADVKAISKAVNDELAKRVAG